MGIFKIFHDWFLIKPKLAIKESKVLFKQGEIWWCYFGINVGEEIYGKGPEFKRPVLIFKKFTKNSFLALPLTSQEHVGSWYVKIAQSEKKNWVTLNQARIIVRKRLKSKIMTVGKRALIVIKEKFLDFYSS